MSIIAGRMRGFAPKSEKWPAQKAHGGKAVEVLKHMLELVENYLTGIFLRWLSVHESKFSVEQSLFFMDIIIIAS